MYNIGFCSLYLIFSFKTGDVFGVSHSILANGVIVPVRHTPNIQFLIIIYILTYCYMLSSAMQYC
jgi:hypothetical protein